MPCFRALRGGGEGKRCSALTGSAEQILDRLAQCRVARKRKTSAQQLAFFSAKYAGIEIGRKYFIPVFV